MNRIVRKYFLPILLGSVLVFAIDSDQVSASSTSSNYHEECFMANLLRHLEDDEFWGKFRESVMKDRDRNDPNDGEHGDPARGGDFGGDDHGPGGNDRGGDGPGGRGGDGHGGGGGGGRR